MEKLDRIVALVGALVLVGAVGYAATAQGPGGTEHALVYTARSVDLPDVEMSGALPLAGGTVTGTIPAMGNVSLVEVNLTVRAVAPTDSSFRASLKAPNGTVVAEQEIAIPAASQGATALTLVGFVMEVPASTRGGYASAEEARAALVPNDANGTGDWALEYSYAPGLAPAAAQLEVAHAVRVVVWTAEAVPVAPEGK